MLGNVALLSGVQPFVKQSLQQLRGGTGRHTVLSVFTGEGWQGEGVAG